MTPIQEFGLKQPAFYKNYLLSMLYKKAGETVYSISPAALNPVPQGYIIG
jgi:hypothetical protein